MTLADILTLSKAGFTAQQITAMNQQDFQQGVQTQPVQYAPVQQAAQQVMQARPVQYAQQAQPVQYVQAQPVQYVQEGTGYVPTLPPTAQADPMKDVMLQNYMNVPGTNMYNVHDVVADMIGATAPAGLTQTGGNK